MSFSWEGWKRQMAHDDSMEGLSEARKGAFDAAWESYELSHNRCSARYICNLATNWAPKPDKSSSTFCVDHKRVTGRNQIIGRESPTTVSGFDERPPT
ncbi:VMS1 [Venturia inaequalis]|nr:VMS1 [Venturia inaequalis]